MTTDQAAFEARVSIGLAIAMVGGALQGIIGPDALLAGPFVMTGYVLAVAYWIGAWAWSELKD